MSFMKSIIRSAPLFAIVLTTQTGWAKNFAPTSFEIVYQPTYTLAAGGPTSQFSSLGGGLRLGYEMAHMIGFELGGYYVGYTFGNIAGTTQTAYAARATGDFMFAPHPGLRLYLGADANVIFNPPTGMATTNNKDIGIIGGLRILIGGPTKVFFGAEYRYALATVMTYTGGSINNSAVLGNFGIHFGGI